VFGCPIAYLYWIAWMLNVEFCWRRQRTLLVL